jgi:gas vesicle protein
MKSKRFITIWKRGSLKNREQIEHKMDETMKINMVETENKIHKKMNENSPHMENKMDENKEEIQKSMKELQNSLSSIIFLALD